MAGAPAVLKALVLLLPGTLALLAGCGSGRAHEHGAAGPVPDAVRAPAVDASFDWHGQVIAPFGVLLKSSPVPLHEVLLFQDDAENQDCYAIDGTPPRLLGQTPVGYLLCFDHDRLKRIESRVHLPAGNAAQVFAQACESWQARTAPTAGICEGQSGTTAFTAHLSEEPGEPATLSLVLANANAVP